ncbi:formyl transferase [Salinicoccus luteus]|uniref:formyl transferase n=1 Tax=Salinicoccus luteus TaxID=367840 RepID=UPI0004E1A639|nr:formyl transferase [Salinicoccus luteus]
MKRIMMICTLGVTSNYVYNNVTKAFPIDEVVAVEKMTRIMLLKKRIKRLGLPKATGQVIFSLYSKAFLKKEAEERIQTIQKMYGLDDTDIPEDRIRFIHSVNSKDMKDRIREVDPDLIIINGTPIIKDEILSVTDAKFVNIHVGITPKYRGVYGGYWALYNNEAELAGVTTHFVDAGIDTGEVLDQKVIEVTEEDNFMTYPHLQEAYALMDYNRIIGSILDDNFEVKQPMTQESTLWYHPTIFSYLYGRVIKKVK